MKVRHEISAGIFIIVALILFAASVWIMGQDRQIFSDQEQYSATFSDVGGLAEGAPVRLGGISIGRVSHIGFSKELSDPRVHVKLLINENYLDRLRDDSIVTIETQGLLGDKFVSIMAGQHKDQLPPGSEIKSSEPGDISEVLKKAGAVVDNIANMSSDFKSVASELKSTTLGDISEAAAGLSKLAKQIEKGDGLAHRLFYSKKDADDIIGNLKSTANDVSSVVKEIKTGDGLLHQLVYDPKGKELLISLDQASKNLAATSQHISDIAAQVKSGDGLVHDLIYTKSDQGIEEILLKLNQSADNFKRASEALANGSGTIGALLVDSKLYDNLVEVTDGAKRSIILRSAIRSAMSEKVKE